MAEKKNSGIKLKEEKPTPIIHDEPDVDDVGEPRLSKRRVRRKKPKELQQERRAALRSQTKRGIAGVACITLAAFFTLAGFGLAGALGSTLFIGLSSLFGTGYALIPLSLCLWAIALFQDITQEVGFWRGIGTTLFFIASLSLLHTVSPGSGGFVGSALTNPLIGAIAVPATVVVLLALIAISLLVIFDAQFTLPSWLTKKPDEADDLSIKSHLLDEAEEPLVEVPELEEPDPEPEPVEEKSAKKRTSSKTSSPDEEAPAIPVFSLPLRDYTPPPLSLLEKNKGKPTVGDVKANANIIKRTLQNFGIDVEMDEVSIGPSVTRFALKPAEGVRLSRIVSLQNNLELALAASPVRIEAPIPGKALVGVEVPNQSRTMLGMGSILSNDEFKDPKKPLMIALGSDISGTPHYANLAKMPHVLIAGATGSGKSVTIHDLIVSLLYRSGPEQLRFVMIDPKRVELTLYNDIPHLLTPVITDPKKAVLSLKWLTKEMDRRYSVLEAESVRDISSYHQNIYYPALEKSMKKNGDLKVKDNTGTSDAKPDEQLPAPMPYIVTIIDELADLMQTYPRELEAAIVRLAQMSRAVGIHLVIATQRPSVKVITGLIKANVPARIALQVASQIDSRTILDMGGAENLLGAGDMLYLSGEMSKPVRIQAPYISETELKAIVKFLAKQFESRLPDDISFGFTAEGGGDASLGGIPESALSGGMSEGSDDDDMYEEAKAAVIEAGKASTSYLQRKLRIGYSRAARLMDILEQRGVIGAADGAKPREVIAGGQSSNDTQEDT
jgi:S-DNA-T family DNA segregation ATPase FtsK/SpoIIIE